MIAQNNVTHLYVCDNVAPVTTAAPTVARTMGMKKAGETLCSIEAISTANSDGFQILYMDNASKLQVSPVFYWNDLVSKRKVAATSDAAQVVAVGYNGTTGSIEVNNGGNYLLTIGYKEGTKQFNKRLYRYGQYTADATATQYEILNGVQDSLLKSMAKDPYVMFKVEKINAGALANALGTSTVSVVNGSKNIVCSEDMTSLIVVGTLLRFGTTGAGTAPVYKVTSVGTGIGAARIYTLDQPYQGVTNATFAAASFESVTEGNYGLLITAMDSNRPFEVGKWAFNPLRFDVGLSTDFGSTITTINTYPAKGNGTYKDIATIEWELIGNRREAYRIAEYPLNSINTSLAANSAETYTTYTLQFREDSTNTIGGTADSLMTLMIAADQTDDTLTTQLDTIFGF